VSLPVLCSGVSSVYVCKCLQCRNVGWCIAVDPCTFGWWYVVSRLLSLGLVCASWLWVMSCLVVVVVGCVIVGLVLLVISIAFVTYGPICIQNIADAFVWE
jgi:hypothetical protein